MVTPFSNGDHAAIGGDEMKFGRDTFCSLARTAVASRSTGRRGRRSRRASGARVLSGVGPRPPIPSRAARASPRNCSYSAIIRISSSVTMFAQGKRERRTEAAPRTLATGTPEQHPAGVPMMERGRHTASSLQESEDSGLQFLGSSHLAHCATEIVRQVYHLKAAEARSNDRPVCAKSAHSHLRRRGNWDSPLLSIGRAGEALEQRRG